jgi:hypothetical protein
MHKLKVTKEEKNPKLYFIYLSNGKFLEKETQKMNIFTAVSSDQRSKYLAIIINIQNKKHPSM